MGSIVDNRTLVDDAEGTVYDDLGGGAAGTADTEIFKYLTQSQGYYSTTTRDGLLHDAATAQDWSDNIFYIWFNCGVAGLLDDQINGGITIRFCGATVTDYFEVYVGGRDTYSGGWKMFVVDIEDARRLATVGSPTGTKGGTGGTPPATTAIRYVGMTTITAATMPRMVDNTWVDAIWRLPASDPGIIVNGDNGGSPYNWDDINLAGDVADVNKAWGTIVKANGIFLLSTPIQFGNNGSPTFSAHDFEADNVVVAWESNIVRDSFYGLTIVGDSVGTQRFVQGVNGSAGQGLTMLAASDGPRWFFESVDVDIDNVGLYGCSFTHTAVVDMDNSLVDMYDSLLIDGQKLWHSRLASPRSGADFRRNSIISADPIYGEGSPAALTSPANIGYCHSADLDKIIDCTWNYFSGHAIVMLEARNQNFVGNVFTNQWLSGNSPDGQQSLDAALLNEVGDMTLSVSGGGNTPTYFDAQSPGTEIQNNISVTITDIEPNTEIRVYPVESPFNTTEIAGVENSGSPAEFTFSGSAGLVVDIVVLNVGYVLPPDNRIRNFTIPTSDSSFPISQIIDRNYSNP